VFFIALAVLVVKSQKRKKLNAVQPLEPEPYAYLSELSGDQISYALVKNAIRIGRNIENDISLKNETISSHHAEIQRRRTGDVFIVDLASANGVFVNESKITQMQLITVDVIELGEVRLRFESI
jgi:pSer/pThr/pTyr-binding forkhead associated (FHA) protein